MKEMVRKLVGIITCFALVASLAACGGKTKRDTETQGSDTAAEEVKKDKNSDKDEAKEVKKDKNSDEAKEVVDNFMSAFCDLDMEKLNDYLDEKSEDFENFDLMEEMTGGMDEEGDMKEVLTSVIDIMKDNMEYEIKETEKDGDKVNVLVEFKSINFSKLGDKLSNLDDSAINKIVTDLTEQGKITEDMSEDEMMEIIIPEIIKLMEDEAKEMKQETAELKFVVIEDDGKWVISNDDSDIDAVSDVVGG